MRRGDPDLVGRERVLRTLCRLLAPAAGGPPAPDGPGEPEAWEAIVALASEHLVTPELAWALNDRSFGPEVDDYLAGMLALNAARNAVLLSALPPILTALDGVGATPVLLKGAAALADGLHPAPEMRFLGDIDILVPRDRIAAASAALREIGYVSGAAAAPDTFVRVQDRRGRPHLPGQVHPATGVGVELHWRIFGRLHDPIIPAERCLSRCEAGTLAGARYHTLHPTDRVIHTIAHAQVWHGLHAMRAIELRQMTELIRLDRRDRARIDWPEVEAAFERGGHGAVLATQACLLRALFGWTLPLGAPGVAGVAYDASLWRGRSRAWVAVALVGSYLRRAGARPGLLADLFQPTVRTTASYLAPGWLKRAAKARFG